MIARKNRPGRHYAPRRPVPGELGLCPTGKFKHVSKGAARVELARIVRDGLRVVPGQEDMALRPYRCDSCGCWHVGHRAIGRGD